MKKAIQYPFVPKSNSQLIPGQFFNVHLKNGKHACGRVLAVPSRNMKYGGRTTFLAGLMDWVGDTQPTAESIAGHKIIKQGQAHVGIIGAHGDGILGYRAPELDGTRPLEMFSPGLRGYPVCGRPIIYRGFKYEKNTSKRSATDEEITDIEKGATSFVEDCTWGFDIIVIAAEAAYEEGVLKP